MPASLTVTRLALLVPVALLACACGTSGTTTVTTVTRTVTAPPPTSAPATDAASDAPATDAGGAGSASAAASVVPDACSLLTQAQAEAVAGTPLMKAVGAGANPSGGYVECQWVGPTTGPTAQVEVFVGDGAQQQLHIDRDNLKHTFTSVPGIGDQCLQEDGFIFVHKGGVWASINLVRLNDPAQNVQPMRTGIREVAAHLP